MNDAHGMSLGQRLARLEQVLHGDLGGEGSVLGQHRVEVAPVEVLHHQVGGAVGHRPHVAHPRHVLAAEARRGAPLAEEASDELRVLQRLRPEELDGDALPELEVLGHVNNAHAPFPEDALDEVLVGDDLADAHGGIHARGASHGGPLRREGSG